MNARKIVFIDAPCCIGKGTKIWHCSHIMAGAVIGRDCSLGQNVVVAGSARLGDCVRVQNNVSVYSGVTCEDDVFLGPSCVFTNVLNPRSFVPRKAEYRKTLVRRGASIGANATILCGCTVGRYALVGAGAVVTHNVPDYAVAVGNPARVTGWVCRCGERLTLQGYAAACAACGLTYRCNRKGEVIDGTETGASG